MTFKDWLVERMVIRGVGYSEANDEVDSFLQGNLTAYTKRARAVLIADIGTLDD